MNVSVVLPKHTHLYSCFHDLVPVMEMHKIFSAGWQATNKSCRVWSVLVPPKTRGVVAPPYQAIDTPISHIWAEPHPFCQTSQKFKNFNKNSKNLKINFLLKIQKIKKIKKIKRYIISTRWITFSDMSMTHPGRDLIIFDHATWIIPEHKVSSTRHYGYI